MDLKNLGIDVKTVILVSVTVILAVVISRIVRFTLGRFLEKSSKLLKVDPTRYKFFKNGVSLVIYAIALTIIFFSIPSLRVLGISLFASAGILAAILGFASQQTFSNIVSGIFIVIFRPFRVGDIIKVGESYFGIVDDITLRHTVIRDFENKRIIIPNTVISSETVVNSSIDDKKIRRHIDLGISYDSDIDRAIAIIQDEATKHPYFLDNRKPEDIKNNIHPVEVRVLGFGESSVNLRAYVWAEDAIKAFQMHCDLNKSIKKQFDQEGIEIPFPYRTIVYKKEKPSSVKLNR